MEVNYKEVNDFIEKVFNYYNGKINILNPNVILEINWINGDCKLYGSLCTPGRIIIYIKSILNNPHIKNFTDIKIVVIETIIHELFHADQNINFEKYYYDNEYKNNIENAVQRQSYIYMASHIIEIKNIFDIDIDFKFTYNLIYNYEYAPYIKFNDIDYIASLLENILGIKTYNEIVNYISNRIINSVLLYLNQKCIYLIKDGYLCDIAVINDFLYENYFIYDFYKERNTEFKIVNDELIIKFTYNNFNILCEKVIKNGSKL